MKRTLVMLAGLAVSLSGLASSSAQDSTANLDKVPVAKFQARPQYPFYLRKDRIPGEVVVDFIVDTHGDVRNAYAVKWSHPGFVESAVWAVSQWKFRPGIKGGKPVNTHMQVPLVFSLDEVDENPANIVDPELLYNLGVWYLNGVGRQQNDAIALDCYRRSAEKNYLPSMYALGLMYANGRGVPKNLSEAMKWFLKAAEKKYGPAQCAVGMAYASGEGVTKDLPTAVSWYQKSAKQKCARGQYLLAIALDTGAGIQKDPEEAAKLLKLAARQNLVAAEALLGEWYCVAEGVPKDFIQAYVWFSLASAAGDKAAKENLERVGKELSPAEKTNGAYLAAGIAAEFHSAPQ